MLVAEDFDDDICELLDFSGIIYHDHDGNRVNA